LSELIKNKVFVIIPAKDESSRITQVISKTLEEGFTNIVVVNDGSSDNTGQIADSFADVTVLHHWINLGPGASTYTGIRYAVEQGAEIVVTIDADNQHDATDIYKLVEEMYHSDYDMVLGSRFLQVNDIPKSRIFYNKIGNFISYFVTGVYLTDSQSGLKALSRNFCKFLEIKHNGFEFCIEIIKQAKIYNAKIKELPISVTYTKETMQKGQNLISGFTMVARLLKPF
jgi:glycosyltransferase involved in cell wall biosynthesis